jgi:hypothetical protein
LKRPFFATAMLPPHSPPRERGDVVEVGKRLGRVLAALHHARCCNNGRNKSQRSFTAMERGRE